MGRVPPSRVDLGGREKNGRREGGGTLGGDRETRGKSDGVTRERESERAQ